MYRMFLRPQVAVYFKNLKILADRPTVTLSVTLPRVPHTGAWTEVGEDVFGGVATC